MYSYNAIICNISLCLITATSVELHTVEQFYIVWFSIIIESVLCVCDLVSCILCILICFIMYIWIYFQCPVSCMCILICFQCPVCLIYFLCTAAMQLYVIFHCVYLQLHQLSYIQWFSIVIESVLCVWSCQLHFVRSHLFCNVHLNLFSMPCLFNLFILFTATMQLYVIFHCV